MEGADRIVTSLQRPLSWALSLNSSSWSRGFRALGPKRWPRQFAGRPADFRFPSRGSVHQAWIVLSRPAREFQAKRLIERFGRVNVNVVGSKKSLDERVLWQFGIEGDFGGRISVDLGRERGVACFSVAGRPPRSRSFCGAAQLRKEPERQRRPFKQRRGGHPSASHRLVSGNGLS